MIKFRMAYKEVIYKCSNCGYEMKVEERGMVIKNLKRNTGVYIANEIKTYICEKCGYEIKQKKRYKKSYQERNLTK